MRVPTEVPSVTHNSRKRLELYAVNKTRLPNTVKLYGSPLPLLTVADVLISINCVPARVPSVTQASRP